MRFHALSCAFMRFHALSCAFMRFHALSCAFMLPLLILTVSVNTIEAQDCGSNFDLKKLKQTNPKSYQEYLRLEKIISDYRQRMTANPNARLIDENGLITIPLVFHVIHRGEAVGTGTNIPDARIIDQVAVLNECFTQTNGDQGMIEMVFRDLAGNPNIRFALACRNPNGGVTNGIVRRQSMDDFFANSDNIKTAPSTNHGGDNPWPTDRYLNIWVAPNLDPTAPGNLFGYCPFPNDYSSNPNGDGVVVRFDVIGRNATNFAGRREGRTLVHEIGHWLDLIHLFDNGCSNNDGCNDTPPQSTRTPENVVCPITFPRNANICTNTPNGAMYDNFMDGTNENCGRRMFTRDQVIRMRAMFQPGGIRRSFIDNYFKLVHSGYRTCVEEFDFVASPFCEAAGNINWSITGPASLGFSTGFSTYVNPWQNANGTATLTASWNNFTTDLTIPVGYGAESSSYTPNYPSSGYVPLTVNQVHSTSYNKFTYGQVSFTGATGQAQNWRFLTNSSSSTTISGGNSNSFWIRFTQPGAFATIRADIPTLCGLRTVDYSFTSNLSGGYQYRLSPNPATNNITINASNVSIDPNARVEDTPEFEIQIFSRYSQLMKTMKYPKGSTEIQMDVSNLPSNQLYTARIVSSTDTHTLSFFKE
jgi:hypothetical protein